MKADWYTFTVSPGAVTFLTNPMTGAPVNARGSASELTPAEFSQFCAFFFEETGIELDGKKKSFLASRLASRLAALNLPRYDDYFRFISQPENKTERLRAIDLLTTHETWFFREAKHFDRLREKALNHHVNRPFRVWSAACSSGEEAYSIALTLADALDPLCRRWELLASDISWSSLEVARSARYSLSRSERIPRNLLEKYCLRGVRSQDGTFRISNPIRANTRFELINLIKPLPELPMFDVVFLRNTLIYFKPAARRRILNNIAPRMAADGLLFISHAESLQGLDPRFQMIKPGVYSRREATPS